MAPARRVSISENRPKPFRLGAEVDEGLVLQAQSPRQAQLGGSLDGPATLTLDMPIKN